MKTYIAQKTTSTPEWNKAVVLKDFKSPWTTDMVPPMSFRALWNETAFLFRFEVEDLHIKVFTQTNHKMEVVQSDRVELFFRSDEKMNPYYCLEMDPLGRVLDYKTNYYRKFEYDWRWPGTDHLQIKSVFLPDRYQVEGIISLKSLRELNLLQHGILETGIFRGKCLGPMPDPAFNWISWEVPDSEKPDFHIPSAFGKILLA